MRSGRGGGGSGGGCWGGGGMDGERRGRQVIGGWETGKERGRRGGGDE